MRLLQKGVSLMPGIYSDKYKTLLNTLRVYNRLSIDRVCLLSACHEVATLHSFAVPLITPSITIQNGRVAFRGKLWEEKRRGKLVLNYPLKLPDGTGRLQMSADG
ncbi:uncharacterized [Tachysurus ichikawai]